MARVLAGRSGHARRSVRRQFSREAEGRRLCAAALAPLYGPRQRDGARRRALEPWTPPSALRPTPPRTCASRSPRTAAGRSSPMPLGRGWPHRRGARRRARHELLPALAAYLERGDVIVHNHPSGTLRPSEADVGVSAEAGASGVGPYIVNNAVDRVHIVAEPARRKPYSRLDEDEISGVLEEGGKLSDLIPGDEPRKSQIRLTRTSPPPSTTAGSSRPRRNRRRQVLRHPAPAFAWAIKNEERVDASTGRSTCRSSRRQGHSVVQKLFKKKTKAARQGPRRLPLPHQAPRGPRRTGDIRRGRHRRGHRGEADITATGDRPTSPSTPTSSSGRGSSPSRTPPGPALLRPRGLLRAACAPRGRRRAGDRRDHQLLFADLAAGLKAPATSPRRSAGVPRPRPRRGARRRVERDGLFLF